MYHKIGRFNFHPSQILRLLCIQIEFKIYMTLNGLPVAVHGHREEKDNLLFQFSTYVSVCTQVRTASIHFVLRFNSISLRHSSTDVLGTVLISICLAIQILFNTYACMINNNRINILLHGVNSSQ